MAHSTQLGNIDSPVGVDWKSAETLDRVRSLAYAERRPEQGTRSDVKPLYMSGDIGRYRVNMSVGGHQTASARVTAQVLADGLVLESLTWDRTYTKSS